MGLISGIIAQGAVSLVGNSKANKMLLLTVAIVEKHRKYLLSKGEQNSSLEKFISKNSKMYNKTLKKL